MAILTSIIMAPNSVDLKNNEIKSLNILERNTRFLRNKNLTYSNMNVVYILSDFASLIKRSIHIHFQDAKH